METNGTSIGIWCEMGCYVVVCALISFRKSINRTNPMPQISPINEFQCVPMHHCHDARHWNDEKRRRIQDGQYAVHNAYVTFSASHCIEKEKKKVNCIWSPLWGCCVRWHGQKLTRSNGRNGIVSSSIKKVKIVIIASNVLKECWNFYCIVPTGAAQYFPCALIW